MKTVSPADYRVHGYEARAVFRSKSYLKSPGQEERIKAHTERIQKALKGGVK
jgi:hypothetical protein